MCASNESLASMGRYGDTELAHVTPHEKALLKSLGGAGTTNPRTGLKEYYSPPPEKPRTSSPLSTSSPENRYGLSIKEYRNLIRKGGLKLKVNPDTGALEHINKLTGKTLYVDKDYVRPEDDNLPPPPKTTIAPVKPPTPVVAPVAEEGRGRGGGRVRGDEAWLKQQEALKKQLDEKYGGDWNWNSRTYRWEDPETEKKLDQAQAKKWSEYQALIKKKEQAKRDYWDAKFNKGPLGGLEDLISNLTKEIKNFSMDINYDEWKLPTPQELIEDIGDFTEDFKEGIGKKADLISDVTPDIKITDTSTGDIVKQIDKVYQGSDIDKTAEGVQEAGELMWDVVDSIISGEAKGGVKDAKDDLGDFKDKGDKAVEHIKETATNLLDPNNPNSLINTTVADTNKITQQIAHNISRDFTRRMGKQGLMTLDSNYDPSLDDPYLMTRRGRRRRGREKDVRQGALRIPTTGIGLNIPA